MNVEITRKVQQSQGFAASVPHPFPPKGVFAFEQKLLNKAAEADRLVGKLDGITQILPDIDFFLKMYIRKDATSSAQIEGTRATIIDAIEMEAKIDGKQSDAQDILFYIKALNYGIKRIDEFPMSLRFIREVHSKLMTGARSTHFSDPGEFRHSQNWIGGTTPADASFVPPPVGNMNEALNNFEKFLYDEESTLPLIQIGIIHSQFETIHPFLDGNGRTGRLLITLLLYKRGLLEHPVLFLSSYFKKHQKVYYDKLDGYHNGKVDEWMDFFLGGVIETANEAIAVSKKIRKLRDDDMAKLLALAKRESESGVLVLSKLYANPIVNTRIIMQWTGFSRVGAQKLINRFVKMNILKMADNEDGYDRKYRYEKYLDSFFGIDNE
ncbi:MAG: Fic family protein [Patescibacteria group bacterium]|nr:Fic family protein [Patescibacteria group bacterium]